LNFKIKENFKIDFKDLRTFVLDEADSFFLEKSKESELIELHDMMQS
jgi:superfamily II DNA/RNA helicase